MSTRSATSALRSVLPAALLPLVPWTEAKNLVPRTVLVVGWILRLILFLSCRRWATRELDCDRAFFSSLSLVDISGQLGMMDERDGMIGTTWMSIVY